MSATKVVQVRPERIVGKIQVQKMERRPARNE